MEHAIPTYGGPPTPWGRASRSADGFTLIEVLVAMMILAVSMVMIMQLFSGGLKSESLSRDYNHAILHARATMEETLLREPLEEGIEEGEFDDGFRWKTEVALHEPPDEALEEDEEEEPLPLPVKLLAVTVEIGWPGESERTYRITTLKVVENDDED